MLIEAIILALVLGYLLGGRLSILKKVEMRGLHFVLLAFLIEYLAGYLMDRQSLAIAEWILENTLVIQIVVYVLLGIFFALNFRYLGVKFLALGSFLNFLVITANRGLMPVKTDMALRLGFYDAVQSLKSGAVYGHKILEWSSDALIALGDIIEIPEPYFFPKTISLGDMVIGFGAFFVVFLNMFYSKNHNRPV